MSDATGDGAEYVSTAFVAVPWRVKVLRGLPVTVEEDAPVVMGVPTVTVGGGGLSDPAVDLEYGPVGLRSEGTWCCIESPMRLLRSEYERQLKENGSVSVGTRIHRELQHVTKVEFDSWGTVRVEGLEERPDGSVGLALWEVSPYVEDGTEGEDR